MESYELLMRRDMNLLEITSLRLCWDPQGPYNIYCEDRTTSRPSLVGVAII